MKAIVLHAHGGPESLSYEEAPDPIPAANEVLIRVIATALNHVDIDVRNGTSGVESTQSLPHVPGVDAVGVVQSVGSSVSLWKKGDRVAPHFILSCSKCPNCRGGRENICTASKILGLTHWGGYAEFVCVPEHNLVGIPDGVGLDEAAAGMTPFSTAWEALIVTAGLKAGETVLITGAGGGVGSHAVQVAALAGAKVIACAGADYKIERVKELGVVDEIVNYKKESLVAGVMRVTGGTGVDVAFDGIGGQILKDCIQCLTDGGRIASIGAHGGEVVDIDMIQFFRKHLTMHGCGRSTRGTMAKVLDLMARRKLVPIVDRKYPLRQAKDAHEVMEGRDFCGRILLLPNSSLHIA
ncbi:putative Enoyl reductase (ER) domain-containing protein [Seiridium cardinale]|uniref:Enoyl reductase (ER) domain-containing protein n=1 Tax=Seiridium cardinale TaxID=138064 RepID=A0ABR2X7T7_9PEZI